MKAYSLDNKFLKLGKLEMEFVAQHLHAIIYLLYTLLNVLMIWERNQEILDNGFEYPDFVKIRYLFIEFFMLSENDKGNQWVTILSTVKGS